MFTPARPQVLTKLCVFTGAEMSSLNKGYIFRVRCHADTLSGGPQWSLHVWGPYIKADQRAYLAAVLPPTVTPPFTLHCQAVDQSRSRLGLKTIDLMQFYCERQLAGVGVKYGACSLCTCRSRSGQ